MSAPPKKHAFDLEDSGSDSGEEMSDEEGVEYTGQEKIELDFEGRAPSDSDFHGIKQLLQQLFLKAHLNLSELTDMIIGQSNIGCVVKQSDTEEVPDDESDDDDDIMEVFGVNSVINLSSQRNIEVVNQLRSLLIELSTEHSTEEVSSQIRSILSDDSKPLGLVINERFVNIPPQLAVPLLESLSKEIKRACDKKLPYDFSYYLFICKLYKMEDKSKNEKRKKKKKESFDVLWSNPEEEVIDQMADLKFEFCVKDEADSGLSGNWLEGDDSMIPYRRVLFVSADKLDTLVSQIKLAVQTE